MVTQVAQGYVAPAAEQAADLAGLMAVVDAEPAILWWALADRAMAALRREQCDVGGFVDTVLGPDPLFPSVTRAAIPAPVPGRRKCPLPPCPLVVQAAQPASLRGAHTTELRTRTIGHYGTLQWCRGPGAGARHAARDRLSLARKSAIEMAGNPYAATVAAPTARHNGRTAPIPTRGQFPTRAPYARQRALQRAREALWDAAIPLWRNERSAPTGRSRWGRSDHEEDVVSLQHWADEMAAMRPTSSPTGGNRRSGPSSRRGQSRSWRCGSR